MNIVLPIEEVNINNTYFGEPIVNTVMDDSKFIKILYSNEFITLNGIFINFPLKITTCENYFRKLKYSFDLNINRDMLQKVFTLEKIVLEHYNTNKKQIKYTLKESILTGILKIFPNTDINDTSYNNNNNNNTNNKFVLKISGIWESPNELGLTYKISSI